MLPTVSSSRVGGGDSVLGVGPPLFARNGCGQHLDAKAKRALFFRV